MLDVPVHRVTNPLRLTGPTGKWCIGKWLKDNRKIIAIVVTVAAMTVARAGLGASPG